MSESSLSGRGQGHTGLIETMCLSFTVFTAWCYAYELVAMGLCLCLSQVGALLKRLNVG